MCITYKVLCLAMLCYAVCYLGLVQRYQFLNKRCWWFLHCGLQSLGGISCRHVGHLSNITKLDGTQSTKNIHLNNVNSNVSFWSELLWTLGMRMHTHTRIPKCWLHKSGNGCMFSFVWYNTLCFFCFCMDFHCDFRDFRRKQNTYSVPIQTLKVSPSQDCK